MLRTIALWAAILLLTACAPPERSLPESALLADTLARPVGYDAVRIWGDAAPAASSQDRLLARAANRIDIGPDGRLNILALSGGGADGAYGAGILAGWTQEGTRPQFDIVTGISTGAIIAPFAFLGPEFDANLRRFYTQTTTSDVVVPAILPAIFRGEASIGSSAPLAAAIERELPDSLIARIAAEHRKGRRLLIGTTHLDAQRPVIWDVGAIAASDRTDAPDLVRRVILASTAIPAAFSPVLFEVTDGAQRWSELHVDGSVTREVFAYPADLRLSDLLGSQSPRARNIWVIYNGVLSPESRVVTPRSFEIATRALDTLVKARTRRDLELIERTSARDGLAFHLTTIPRGDRPASTEPFDPDYMAWLFELGRKVAASPTHWYRSLTQMDRFPVRVGP